MGGFLFTKKIGEGMVNPRKIDSAIMCTSAAEHESPRPVLLDIQDINRVNLKNIIKDKTELEVSFEVRAKASYYPSQTIVYIPNRPFTKIKNLYELANKNTKPKKGKQNVEDIERSIRRTKKNIKDYALCNAFELFATFTFSPEKTKDRADVATVKKQMSNWLKNQNKRSGKFGYLIVPEFHKDGKSLHFHALLTGYKGKLTPSGTRIHNRPAYNFKSYKLGHNSAVFIDDISKVSSYVRKYITKDMPLFPGKHRFWCSKGLKLPQVEYNPPEWYLAQTPDWSYQSDYGLTLCFLKHTAVFTGSRNITEDSAKLSLTESEN